ncbi:NAD-dependent epimerase/dehydratase family protein [Candidatus Woesearchaeota archaeon]|jgi:GlcNAc-P-P-Und epimerase|nr:NAD-dependent epimerase/dehydratase family protein [Candidatus Woesearchaeota archaeon]
MKENRIAVIGGTGFVGTRLADRFTKRNIPFAIYDIDISNRSGKIIYLDIEDQDSLDQLAMASSIINLAAVHRDDIRPLSRYDDVNVQGAVNICNAARKHGINEIIFTSTVAIYGFAPADTNESGEPNYFNDYGRTKYLAEGVYKEWQAEDPENRTIVIVRPTVIFGEGNRGNVYNLLKQIASRRFVMFGNGKNKKSMAYVENVAAFLEYSLSFKPGLHIYNYIDKPDFDMNTLISIARKSLFRKDNVGLRMPAFLGMAMGYIADAVAKLISKSLPVSSIRVKKFMGTTQFASSVSDTGFVPQFSLEEGLERTLRYEFMEDNSDERTFDTE